MGFRIFEGDRLAFEDKNVKFEAFELLWLLSSTSLNQTFLHNVVYFQFC